MSTLKNLVIAVTGTLEADNSQLKKWIEANGGRYSSSVRKGITHLIAGKDAWKNASDPVQAAIKAGAFVVTYDWLEDSLQKRRKLAETQYTWEHVWQQRKRRKRMKRLAPLFDAKKFNDGCEEAKKATGTGTSQRSRAVVRKPKVSTSFFFADAVNVPFVSAADDLKRRREEREMAKMKKAEPAHTDRVNSTAPSEAQSSVSNVGTVLSHSSTSSHTLSKVISQTPSILPGTQAKKPSLKDLYHYYLDTTGFEYKVVLTRCNLRANEIARYRLSILESHTKPHVYCTFVEYFPPGGNARCSIDSACIQALFEFNQTYHEDAAPGSPAPESKFQEDVEPQDITFNPAQLPQQQNVPSHPEAARLRSLVTTPELTIPTSNVPYKNLIAPMSSTFPTAWRAFRHAFRDLTMLSWEERFDISKTLYKARAQHFSLEPFVYVRPKAGLPLGLRVQEASLFQNQTLVRMDKTGTIISREQGKPGELPEAENDDAYKYNAFNLPALSHPLGTGIIGTAVQSDIDAANKAAEDMERLAEEAEEARLRRLGRTPKPEKKPNYSRPLFNGVTGRPTTDAWGRPKKSGGSSAGGLMGGGVTQRRTFSKPFPTETGLL